MKIKFIESHSFIGECMTMEVNDNEYFLKPKLSETYEQCAVRLLKEIYNIDFKIEDVKFEWNGTL